MYVTISTLSPSLYTVSIQQQMVSGATDLNKAANDFMSENIATMVNKALKNEPGICKAIVTPSLCFMFLVVKLFYLSYYKSRFDLSHMTDPGKSRAPIDRMYLRPSSSSYSLWKMMYYSPRFRDHHNSKLAIVAFNMEKIFPCIAGKRVMPMCRMYTGEEDGFRMGRPIIEAGDTGNHFRMFRRRPVYGFAIQGCPYLTRHCMPEYWQTTISCMLPRKYCPP